ncbi:hypothetical protein KR100_05735 [Synechococcus sp. KORDI-100]|nr:hypothetical protein KR100_05735 [Synechococcus sp. KORDI-100]
MRRFCDDLVSAVKNLLNNLLQFSLPARLSCTPNAVEFTKLSGRSQDHHTHRSIWSSID